MLKLTISEGSKNIFPLVRFLSWKKSLYSLRPFEYEIYKFSPHPDKKSRRKTLLLAGLGIFFGINIYIIFQKIYEDDISIREKGYPLIQERSVYFIIKRILKTRFYLWMERHLMLNWKEVIVNQISSVDNLDVPKYKEIVFRDEQIDYYMKHRKNVFDFVYLAQSENLFKF